jgi:S1-C subfamily serine protease
LPRTWLHATLIALGLSGHLCVPAMALAASPAPAAKEARAANTPSVQSDFPSIVERYGPAVVNISTTATDQQASAPTPEPIDSDDPFAAFFRRAAPTQASEAQVSPARAISGSGSGFIISPDGLILTTAHVVDSADEATVSLTDKRQFPAKVLMVDPQTDVALLKINADRLPAVKLGDSSHLRVGEQVLAIGSPNSFENMATDGMVSATSHTLPDGTSFPFFQTEIAANPDNSGGPIFNRAGEVVGMHEQIYIDTERLTFAIPINLANKARAQLSMPRKLARGGIGVEAQDVDPGLAGAFGLPHATGALVTSVEPGTSAAASGLKPGDVILQVGQPIEHAADLVDRLTDPQPGTKTVLKLIRNGRPTTVMIGAGAPDDDPPGTAPVPRQSDVNQGDRLGLAMHPLSAAELRANGLPQGLVVDGVGGAAANAGIQPGDIVLSLNGTPVKSQRQVSSLAAKAGKEVALLIQRDNARSFVSLELK